MNPDSYSGDNWEAMDSPELKLDGLCAPGTTDSVAHDFWASSLYELAAVPDVVTLASRLDSDVLLNST